MPAFPESVQRILSLTADINCAPRDLVQVVRHDPVLTGQILKLVNSAYFALSRPIASIKHAVVYVGINTIKHLALSVATVGVLPSGSSAGYSTGQHLERSLATAACARLLAKRCTMSPREGDDGFLAGLLHNIGKLVLALHHKKGYRKILAQAAKSGEPLHRIERATLGTTHFEVGAMVARRWRIDPSIVNAIRYYVLCPDDVQRSVLMDVLVAATVVEQSVRENNDTLALPPATQRRLGVTSQELLQDRTLFEEAIEKTHIFRVL